ncbi:MFS transporter, DHA2 family, multidrug resistance protein [Paracoccus aminovorans]|uniref:MFS transporter, DHA2 family, multidrug resistance protein n=1 Tax=Paracoccus aminovorans TaxID=34004 RepID=A0A1I3DGN6_9RHOB|nr:MFS transporter [Paracoccus aminovorans]CQR84077.1 Methyl viologen resistance protein SmvA [Paracoccus aminovorans]SFH85894.1 MFS transporter, DHA2 family, multidrug resistance protein [Paracoccus aminovorans]
MSVRPSDPRRWLVLLAVMLAFLPVVLDMTILHVAVPTLTQALGATSTQVLWIIDIYPLLMAGLLVPMGTLADRVGNRRILLTGLTIFGIASALAAFAPDAPLLIASRMLLALGGSMIMPCVLGIIRRTFEEEKERGLALGLWGTVGAAGAAVGPLIGGGLLGHFWWGSVFLINVPVMLIVAPACWFLLPRHEKTSPGHWAIGQALLLIFGMISVVYAIKAGFGAKQPLAVVLLVLAFGTALLGAFARAQLRAAQPMLDLSLFAHPAILAGMIMAMVASGALAGVELTLAQELQYVLDKTPLQAGIFMIPIMAAAATGGPVAGWLSGRFGLRPVACLSLAVSALALTWLAFSDFHQPGLMVPALLAGLGLALSIGLTASSIAIMGAVEASEGGAAGSLEATGYELGTGLGITLFGVFMSAVYGRHFDGPAGLSADLAEQAARSIGDSYLVARQLAADQGAAVIAAGRAAFSATHSVLLLTAAALIGALAALVFLLLAKAKSGGASHH